MKKPKKHTSALNELQGVERPDSLSSVTALKLKKARKQKQLIPELISEFWQGIKRHSVELLQLLKVPRQKIN